jgi:hypothetical protein
MSSCLDNISETMFNEGYFSNGKVLFTLINNAFIIFSINFYMFHFSDFKSAKIKHMKKST